METKERRKKETFFSFSLYICIYLYPSLPFTPFLLFYLPPKYHLSLPSLMVVTTGLVSSLLDGLWLSVRVLGRWLSEVFNSLTVRAFSLDDHGVASTWILHHKLIESDAASTVLCDHGLSSASEVKSADLHCWDLHDAVIGSNVSDDNGSALKTVSHQRGKFPHADWWPVGLRESETVGDELTEWGLSPSIEELVGLIEDPLVWVCGVGGATSAVSVSA